jgi:hypothetical protein
MVNITIATKRARQAFDAKIPAPVKDARILKGARRGLSTIEQ